MYWPVSPWASVDLTVQLQRKCPGYWLVGPRLELAQPCSGGKEAEIGNAITLYPVLNTSIINVAGYSHQTRDDPKASRRTRKSEQKVELLFGQAKDSTSSSCLRGRRHVWHCGQLQLGKQWALPVMTLSSREIPSTFYISYPRLKMPQNSTRTSHGQCIIHGQR